MKTAMQELLSEMSHPNWDRLSFDARYEMFDTLLEKEKEQIINAMTYSTYREMKGINVSNEEYYSQTYNN